MKYRFFTVPAMSPGAAEEELNRFIAGHRVSNVERHLVVDGGASFWAVCVTWIDGDAGQVTDAGRRGRVDYKEVLAADEFALYDRLRTLRKERSEAEGLPAFAVFTNEQLAAMVQERVTTSADFAKLAGVGSARAERYGPMFLELLREGVPRLAPVPKPAAGSGPSG
jgi:superfamily II DNA helicase RecQ